MRGSRSATLKTKLVTFAACDADSGKAICAR